MREKCVLRILPLPVRGRSQGFGRERREVIASFLVWECGKDEMNNKLRGWR
jgi:hypothetical protein